MAEEQTDDGDRSSALRGDDLFAHIQERSRSIVASGDAAQVRGIYAEFGDLLYSAYGDGGEAIPVLSRPETLAAITRVLGTIEGLVLDAGCGPNPVAALALGDRPGCRIVGLDLGLGTARLARSVASASGIDLLTIVADLEALPFASGAFDALVCDDTIEHVPDDERAMRELARVLRPRGRMVLATPNRWNVEIIAAKLRDRLRRTRRPSSDYFVTTSHLREYRWRELVRLVAPGFRVRRRLTVGWVGGPRKRVASRLVPLPGLRGFDQMLVLEAEVR